MLRYVCVFLLLLFFYGITQTSALDIACTEEAKMCSDGSFVGRVGPSCEFAACPVEQVCTKEYAPVCGELQVQCIMAPCYPIQETYSNRCMMEAAGAEFLSEGVCKDEDPIICPMNYAPVCGEDGVTYGNSCMAQKVPVKYEGECLSSVKETRISYAWDTAFDSVSSGKTISEIHKILDTAELRLSERQAQNTLSTSLASLYGFIHFLIEETRGQFWVN